MSSIATGKKPLYVKAGLECQWNLPARSGRNAGFSKPSVDQVDPPVSGHRMGATRVSQLQQRFLSFT